MVGGAVRTVRALLLGAVLTAAGSCGTDQQHASLVSGSGGSSGQPSGSAGTSGSASTCADLFSDDRITTYELRIAQPDWDALVHDFYSMQANDDLNLNIHPYHPIAEFKYGNEVVTNAMIRLKGQSSWAEVIAAGDNPPKMQFVISFNEVDTNGRFHGLRKLEMDMPRTDPSYLRQRLALTYLRALGVPAQCANSGRLVINGAYYGLFTNLERPDVEFVRRVFPGQAGGDLWDGGWGLATNEDTVSQPHPRLDAWKAVTDAASLAAIADMDETLTEWAGEAMIADEDGYWIGDQNFFIYDHPTRGWLWIPHDLDATIDWVADVDPIYYWGRETIWAGPWPHYAAVIRDASWRERYVAALRHAYEVFKATKLIDLLDRYAAQVADAAAADPTRPFSVDEHREGVESLRNALHERDELMSAWLACRAAPAGAPDADADGHPVLRRLQRRRSQRVSGGAGDLWRRTRSELRRKRHRRLLAAGTRWRARATRRAHRSWSALTWRGNPFPAAVTPAGQSPVAIGLSARRGGWYGHCTAADGT